MFAVFCDIKQYGVFCVDMWRNCSDKRIDIKSIQYSREEIEKIFLSWYTLMRLMSTLIISKC